MKNNYLNILLISGSGIIAGIINYLYHPIILSFLSLEDFGTFGSLVGIFNLLGVLLVGLDFYYTKNYSNIVSQKQSLKYEFYHSLKVLGIIGIFSYIIFILFTPILGAFLNIEDNHLFYITGCVLIIGFVGVNINALLKSLKAFNIISIQRIAGPIVKLLSGVILLIFGFEISGALLGFIISGLIPLFIGYKYIYKELSKYKSVKYSQILQIKNRSNRREILYFFLMSFIFAFFMNIDVIIVKNIFSAELSGVYTALAILGKFLIFLLLSIETVYFGQIMEHKQQDTPKELIKNPLILITITCLGALIFNAFFGEYVLGFLRSELRLYIEVYMLTLIYYSLISYTSFCIKVLTGWKCYGILYIHLIIGIVGITALYVLNVDSLDQYITVFIIMGFMSATISMGFLFHHFFQKPTSQKNKIKR